MQPIYGNTFIPATRPLGNQIGTETGQKQLDNAGGNFQDILAQKSNEQEKLQFSKHAEMRLRLREIKLSEAQMERAADGVSKAKLKGIKDSLVLVDNVALVVNTKNNMVITAMERGNENIFTNIDGAVIV